MRSIIFKLCLSLMVLGTVTLTPAPLLSLSIFDFVTPEAFGKALVTNFWNQVVQQDVKGYSFLIAKNFQGLNTDGVYNRDDQISGLQGLTVTSFTLENVFVAKYHRTLVISYDFIAEGEGIVSGPSIDVWHDRDGHWKLVSHSYVPFP